MPGSAATNTSIDGRPRSGIMRYSARLLLVTLVLTFMASALTVGMRDGDLIQSGLVSLVLLSAVLAVGGRHRSFATTLALILPAVVGKWVDHFFPHVVPDHLVSAMALLAMAFVIIRLQVAIFRATRVDAEVLSTAIAGYLLMGIFWALALRTDGNTALAGFDAFYFSFVTLCTVGYGDVVPASNVARMLSIMEATIGTFYVAILISRLVAMYSSAPAPAEKTTPEQT
jgi:hypothetical protein